MKATTEEAFEALIEQHLLEHGGYVSRTPSDYDPDLALIKEDLLGFVQETQSKLWAKQKAIHGDKLETLFLEWFDAACFARGVLHVVRHGFKFHGKTIKVAAFRPSSGLNPDIQNRYDANRLAVVRQVHFDPNKHNLSLDLVLFLNGIPLATAELKNALTSQKAGHAVHQYMYDRDPSAPIFKWRRQQPKKPDHPLRALVHFAVGSDEVFMTTRLKRAKTFFLPFNRGVGTASGNPAEAGKHRTFYLWEWIWQRDNFLDIVKRYLHLQDNKREDKYGKSLHNAIMIFPRFHQRACVEKLIKGARAHGAGTNYLVQHSAGSGKSNSIAWLAHRLASLHNDKDEKVYNKVIVISDRRVLDQQLQETISQFDHIPGVVQSIEEGKVKSTQLADALTGGSLIIVCTLQSFGFVSQKLENLPDRRYAIIMDEAHSSQSGEMAQSLRDLLGVPGPEDEDDEDLDETTKLAKWKADRRALPKNVSYFGFTATPKYKTVVLFGTEVGKNSKGNPVFEPSHLYSMRQAIQEKFILDVLRGYTTYKRYFQLKKAAANNPELDKKKAAKALTKFVNVHPKNIAEKVQVILDHFRTTVVKRIGGRGKAMVLTGSRLEAVKYKLAFDKRIQEQGYGDVKTLVAFSGGVIDPDNPATKEDPYTEPHMNKHPVTGVPLKESELPEVFGGEEYNLLVVANKYQTGFDQPLLCSMYVDKRLDGIQAVQALSRLNRTHKGKTETFVLDFVNKREDIQKSFQTYYEGTTVLESLDPKRLYELQGQLDDAQVYQQAEIDAFAAAFFKPISKQVPLDNAHMHAAIDPAVDRFEALVEEDADEFRGWLQAFCGLYSLMAQVVSFSDPDLEKLYAYGRFLLKKLPSKGESTPPVKVDDKAEMAAYKLDLIESGDIELESEDGSAPLKPPSETGTGSAEVQVEKLSKIIELVNERFGTEFDAQDLLDGVMDQMVETEEIKEAALANTRKDFEYVGVPAFNRTLAERHGKHADFIDQIFQDPGMLAFLRSLALDKVYSRARDLPESPTG